MSRSEKTRAIAHGGPGTTLQGADELMDWLKNIRNMGLGVSYSMLAIEASKRDPDFRRKTSTP